MHPRKRKDLSILIILLGIIFIILSYYVYWFATAPDSDQSSESINYTFAYGCTSIILFLGLLFMCVGIYIYLRIKRQKEL